MNLELLGNASCFVLCGRYTSGNESYTPDPRSNLVFLFFPSVSRIVRAELSRGAYVVYSLQFVPNLIAKDGGKNKIWDAGVDFDVGWKKLPFK